MRWRESVASVKPHAQNKSIGDGSSDALASKRNFGETLCQGWHGNSAEEEYTVILTIKKLGNH